MPITTIPKWGIHMKRVLFYLMISLFTVACSASETPAISHEETTSTETKKPEIIESDLEEDGDKEPEILLEFSLPNEQVTINLSGIPILKQFLSNLEDKQKEVENMQLIPIKFHDNNTIYLLEFSCFNASCSYLLLDQSEDGNSLLVADLAKLNNVIISPNNNNFVLLFERVDSNEKNILRHMPIVINRTEGVIYDIELPPEIDRLDYSWPIVDIDWKDESTLTVVLPDINEPSLEEIIAWEESEQHTKSFYIPLTEY